MVARIASQPEGGLWGAGEWRLGDDTLFPSKGLIIGKQT